MLIKLIQWFTRSHMSDIDKYITAQNPKSPADVDRLLNEFNYKRSVNWH